MVHIHTSLKSVETLLNKTCCIISTIIQKRGIHDFKSFFTQFRHQVNTVCSPNSGSTHQTGTDQKTGQTALTMNSNILTTMTVTSCNFPITCHQHACGSAKADNFSLMYHCNICSKIRHTKESVPQQLFSSNHTSVRQFRSLLKILLHIQLLITA